VTLDCAPAAESDAVKRRRDFTLTSADLVPWEQLSGASTQSWTNTPSQDDQCDSPLRTTHRSDHWSISRIFWHRIQRLLHEISQVYEAAIITRQLKKIGIFFRYITLLKHSMSVVYGSESGDSSEVAGPIQQHDNGTSGSSN
jgi:hypothetical protein